MMKTKKLRRLKEQDVRPSESIARERPILDDRVDGGTSPPSGTPEAEHVDSASLKAEFGLGIGSLVEARKSLTRGYLMMVLMPTVALLAIISWLGGQNTDGAGSLIRSMEHMLAVIAVMGLPVLVVFWAIGLYPKGSYGRFVSDLIFAFLLVVWLVFLLLESNLQNAFADFGVALQLDRVLVLACLTAVFSFGRAFSELIDNRKLWRKSIGAKVNIAPLNLKSMFLDFDPRIGTFARGNSSATWAYVRFLIVPTVLLVVIDWFLGEMNLGTKDAIAASVGTMFGTVLLFGIAMVLIHLVRGFYPSGSFGHVTFGLMGIPILFLFAWKILLGSGIQEAFAQNHFIIDMFDVMLPVLMYIVFITVFELSELADCRRSWLKEIGMPVEPYVPEEKYLIFDDFRLRYAMFVAGAKKGVKVLNKYAFRRILPFTILGAIVVSIIRYAGSQFQYPGTQEVFDHVESAFTSWLSHWIHLLLIVAVVLTLGYFLAWSYRAGSFSRLVLTWMVCLFSALWAYVLWGGAANSTNVSYLTLGFNLIMCVFIALAGIKAGYAIRAYTKDRHAYLSWRLLMLDEEAAFAKRRLTAGVPASTGPSPSIPLVETPAFSAEPRGSTFFVEGVPSRASVFSAASLSFDFSSADQGDLRISRRPPVQSIPRQDMAILTSIKASRVSQEGNMASYMAITKKPASKIIERAMEHFGTMSGGVMVKSKTDTSLCLEGPNGFVTISVCPSKSKGKKNEVDIETSQFDSKVREFLARL